MKATLTRYICGHTRFKVSRLFRGATREVQDFPSAAFLYRHTSGAIVLFDTGYAASMRGTGVSGALYTRLLPPHVGAGETIAAQLLADGIDASEVTHVVLSHLHPDHIGGVRALPDATFVLGAGAVDVLRRSTLKEGFFPALLPEWFPSATRIIVDEQRQSSHAHGVTGFDLFGDGRFVITPLPGHARGHIGALVHGSVLLAGDASWSRSALGDFERMRALPRAIEHDHATAAQTAERLLALEAAGVSLHFSHEHAPAGVLLP